MHGNLPQLEMIIIDQTWYRYIQWLKRIVYRFSQTKKQSFCGVVVQSQIKVTLENQTYVDWLDRLNLNNLKVLKIHKTKAVKNVFTRKVYTSVIFYNPWLALTLYKSAMLLKSALGQRSTLKYTLLSWALNFSPRWLIIT